MRIEKAKSKFHKLVHLLQEKERKIKIKMLGHFKQNHSEKILHSKYLKKVNLIFKKYHLKFEFQKYKKIISVKKLRENVLRKIIRRQSKKYTLIGIKIWKEKAGMQINKKGLSIIKLFHIYKLHNSDLMKIQKQR